MDLKQLQQRTKAVRDTFPNKFDKRDVVIDLVEEVGELAQAVMIVEKRKHTNNPAKQRKVEHVANALGDIMYDLILLAEEYGLVLDEEYQKVLVELEERNKRGEFQPYE